MRKRIIPVARALFAVLAGLAVISATLSPNPQAHVALPQIGGIAWRSEWIGWAETAWKYFEPGRGVSPETGLHYATLGWRRFTDWDLGTYLRAILDAEALGLVSKEGPWGSDARIEAIIRFLEDRPLAGALPYLVYDSDSGSLPAEIGPEITNPSDAGRLLLSLDALRRARPELRDRVGTIVARYDYASLANSSYFGYDDLYPTYVSRGFAAFGFQTLRLKMISEIGGGRTVDIYGEQLPKAWVTSEPLVLALLETPGSGLDQLADSVYRAQENRYYATGEETALSEGMYFAPHYYVYEWVTTPLEQSWVAFSGSGRLDAPLVVYTKIAFAYYALYHTAFSRRLVDSVSSLSSPQGFAEGITADGQVLAFYSDKTNGMVLEAARHALQSGGVSAEARGEASNMALAIQRTWFAFCWKNGRQHVA